MRALTLAFKAAWLRQSHDALFLLIMLIPVAIGCGATQNEDVLERMSKAPPLWLKSPETVCPKFYRCSLAEGVGKDLTTATSAAKAKAVSSLISEVAVEISGLIQITDTSSVRSKTSTERTQIIQRVASRVRGQLTHTKTIANYWEKRLNHSADGSTVQYKSFLIVSVPSKTLDKMRQDARSEKAALENDIKTYREQLESQLATGDVPQIDRVFTDLKMLRSRAKSLVLTASLGEHLLDEMERMLANRTQISLLKQEILGGRRLRLVLRVSVAGELPQNVQYRAKAADNFDCEIESEVMTVRPGGLMELLIEPASQLASGVIYLHPTGLGNASTQLTSPAMVAALPFAVESTYRGYSHRYISGLVGDNIEKSVVESSSVLLSSRVGNQPYLLLEFEVDLAPQPSRVTTKLIQIRAGVRGRLFYVGQVRRQIGAEHMLKIAGLGVNERQAALAFAKEAVRAGTEMTTAILSGK